MEDDKVLVASWKQSSCRALYISRGGKIAIIALFNVKEKKKNLISLNLQEKFSVGSNFSYHSFFLHYISNPVIFGVLLCNDATNVFITRELRDQISLLRGRNCIHTRVVSSGKSDHYTTNTIGEDQGNSFISWVIAHPLNMLKSPVTHIPKAWQKQIRKRILPH